MIDLASKMLVNLATVYNLSENDIRVACGNAKAAGAMGLMLMPAHVQVARPEAAGLTLAAVSGYPAGIQPIDSKAAEIRQAYKLGADEVFAVAHNGYIMDGDTAKVEEELRGFVAAAAGCPLTLLIELAVLNTQQLLQLCSCAVDCGIRSFGTSVGFLYNSIFSVTHPEELAMHVCTTNPEDVFKLRGELGNDVEIVAMDCHMDAAKARMLLEAGADRLCAVDGIAIAKG